MSDTWSQNVALTTAVPTTEDPNVTAGFALPLTEAQGFRVIASAQSGATLTDVFLDVYLWEPLLGRWVINKNLRLSQVGANARDIVFPDIPTFVPAGWVRIVSNGTTVSAGTTIDLLIRKFTP